MHMYLNIKDKNYQFFHLEVDVWADFALTTGEVADFLLGDGALVDFPETGRSFAFVAPPFEDLIVSAISSPLFRCLR